MKPPVWDYSPKNLIPQISDRQFALGKSSVTNRRVGDCRSMSSILPDAKTLSEYALSPTLTSILRFDTTIPDGKVSSQVTLSNAGQIHVTQGSVYLTENMWTPKSSSACPPNALCASPMIWNPGAN